MQPLVVPLRSRRFQRAQAFQRLNHAVPAVGLFATGFDALRHGVEGFEMALASVEMATAGLLLGTMIKSLRAARRAGQAGFQHSHGVDWMDIWAAGVLFAEAGERYQLNHHTHIPRPILLTAFITLGLGLFHGRMSAWVEHRRSLQITDEGINVGGKPFRRLRARWTELASIAVNDRDAEIRTRRGRTRRLDLNDLENAADVRRALAAAQERVTALSRGE
jgi:hypothetical protein